MTEEKTPYVDIHKVAEYFLVSVSTIRKWVRSGHIPASTYLKIGEGYRFRIPEIEAALTAATKKAQMRTLTKTNGE